MKENKPGKNRTRGNYEKIFTMDKKPGKDGLLHISEIDWKRFETMEETGIKEGNKLLGNQRVDFSNEQEDTRKGFLEEAAFQRDLGIVEFFYKSEYGELRIL